MERLTAQWLFLVIQDKNLPKTPKQIEHVVFGSCSVLKQPF